MRYVIKYALYVCALFIFMLLELLPEATEKTVLIAAAVLALVNTLIRPLISLIAFPLSILTFGIAAIFVNVLTIVITNGFMGGALDSTFWVKLLLAVVVILLDNGVRYSRHKCIEKTCVLRN